MTKPIGHNKLLKKIAKERLRVHGIFQQGQSRTFLQDNGWFTIVIEFQPSSTSKGTHLNIGVDLNFYPRDYFAFGYGYRESGFEEFKDEVQYSLLINKLCDLSIERVNELNEKFIDFSAAKKTLNKNLETWKKFEVGILCGLTNDFKGAKKLMTAVKEEKCKQDYEFERQKVAMDILVWLDNEATFFKNIEQLIHKTRELKKLPIIDLKDLLERKTSANNTLPQAGRNWWEQLFSN